MHGLTIEPISEALPFGARVRGLSETALENVSVAERLRAAFEDRGLLVFEGLEPTPSMHVRLSEVFGPLKDHPVPAVPRVDGGLLPGVIDLRYEANEPGATVVELAGKPLAQWLPWHFDHCYNDELNRAGVLRAVVIPPEGGMTGFADGVQLYDDFPATLRERIEGTDVLYSLNVVLEQMRFGVPEGFRSLSTKEAALRMNEYARSLPRAIHPAVWTRADGRKVLHVSPWMAEGIAGVPAGEGDDLLDEVCTEIARCAKPYWHSWRPDDMVIWDNWRLLHAVSGSDPSHARRMQRTTIQGDYGLGRFEGGRGGDKLLKDTMV